MNRFKMLALLILYSCIQNIEAQANASQTNNSSPALQYATPPPINSTVLFTLNNSVIGSRFIGSSRIQNLEITQTTNNTLLYSNFKINFFNRTQSNNLQSFTVNSIQGNWSHVMSANRTLSCNLIFESISSKYGLLQFDSNRSRFNIVFQGNSSLFPPEMANLTTLEMPNALVLGQMCQIITFKQKPYLLNLSQNQSSLASWIPLTLPGMGQGGSPDYSFVVSNYTLYQLLISNNTYQPVFNLKHFTNYMLFNRENKLLIISYNFTTADNITFSVNQSLTTAVISGGQSPSLKVISQENFGGNSNTPYIPVKTSPQLTKVSYFFRPPPVNQTGAGNQSNQTAPINESLKVMVKSIDYNQQTASNLTFQNQNDFLNILNSSSPNQFLLGDFFIVVSNRSGLRMNASLQAVEEAFQYVGPSILSVRNRNITSADNLSVDQTFIDPSSTSSLILFQSLNVTGGKQFVQHQYGNLAENNRVIQPAPPAYVNFTIPPSTQQFPSMKSFEWVYQNYANASTLISTFTLDSRAPNNLAANNFTLTGNWSIVTQHHGCKLLNQFGSQNYTIMKLNASSKQFTTIADVTRILANLTITANTQFSISLECDRFTVNNFIYSIIPPNNTAPINASALQQFALIPNNMTNFTWTSSDLNLTIFLVGSSIWGLRPDANNTFMKIYDVPVAVLPQNRLFATQMSIVVTAWNVTAAQVFVYTNSSGGVVSCLNYTFQNYQNTPQIQVSRNMTKILIIGPAIPANSSTVQPKVDIFAINYRSASSNNITSPPEAVKDPANTFISLDDQFIYIRQQPNNASNATTPLSQFIYYLDQDLYPKLALKANINPVDNSTWKKTLILNNPGQSTLLLEEVQVAINMTHFVNVNSRQVSADQANLNGGSSTNNVAGVIQNGKIKLCGTGCNSCSTGTCISCFSGFYLDQTTTNCLACGTNCVTCSTSDANNCSACYPKAYLSGYLCLPCDPQCMTCSGTSSNCSSCPPGQSYINGTCANCSNNCFNCSSPTACLTCRRGFVLTPNGTCRGCSISCSSCSPDNITQCSSCALGLQLVNGACVSCPNNCQQCNGVQCSLCAPGFTPNAAGQCVTQCQLPCATCADNQPAQCLSCYSGAIYNSNNNTCTLNTSCNADSSCTDCGQGFNYILVGTSCLACFSIPSCVQCSPINSQLCALCLPAFYPTSSGCTACSPNCTTCISDSVCTACTTGYTLFQGQTAGSCLQCISPCLTCIGSPTSCSSCVSGFTKSGWKCQNNTYVGFTIVLNSDPATVLGSIDSIVNGLIALAPNPNNTDASAITFTSFVLGSTIASGSFTGISATDITNGLTAGSTLGGFFVNSVSAVAYGGSTTQNTSHKDNDKMGLYIGLGVGIPVVIIAAIVISCVIYRKKQLSKLQSGSVEPNYDNKNAVQILQNDNVSPKTEIIQMTGNQVQSSQIVHVNASGLNWDKQIMNQG